MTLLARLLFCSAALTAPALAASPTYVRETKALEQAMAGFKTPGIAVLEIRHGIAQAEVVRGVRRIHHPNPIRVGDRWNLGSDGKAMTATMVARLVEKGKLRWDTPLSQLLPE